MLGRRLVLVRLKGWGCEMIGENPSIHVSGS